MSTTPPPGISSTPPLPAQHVYSHAQWLQIANHLFSVLDDIDTAADVAKDDDEAYRQLVALLVARRFDVAQTDGYRVVFNVPAADEGRDMPAACEWIGGCANDPNHQVPDGVPVFNLLGLDGEHDGVYCRVHAQLRVSQVGRARRAEAASRQQTEGEG